MIKYLRNQIIKLFLPYTIKQTTMKNKPISSQQAANNILSAIAFLILLIIVTLLNNA